MPYILFIFLIAADGEVRQIETQEFNSQAACEAAGESVLGKLRGRNNLTVVRDAGNIVMTAGSETTVWCVEKG